MGLRAILSFSLVRNFEAFWVQMRHFYGIPNLWVRKGGLGIRGKSLGGIFTFFMQTLLKFTWQAGSDLYGLF